MEDMNNQLEALDDSDIATLSEESLDEAHGGSSVSALLDRPFTKGILIDPINPLKLNFDKLNGGFVNGIPAPGPFGP